MGGQLDGIFLAGSLPHEFIILTVTLFICLWLINFSLTSIRVLLKAVPLQLDNSLTHATEIYQVYQTALPEVTTLWRYINTFIIIIIKRLKGTPYSITERRVPALIPVIGSQPAGDVSHKPGGRLPLLSARPAVTLTTLKRAATSFAARRTQARWV